MNIIYTNACMLLLLQIDLYPIKENERPHLTAHAVDK